MKFNKSPSGFYGHVNVEKKDQDTLVLFHDGDKPWEYVEIKREHWKAFGLGFSESDPLVEKITYGNCFLEKIEHNYGLDAEKGYVAFGNDHEEIFKYIRSLAEGDDSNV